MPFLKDLNQGEDTDEDKKVETEEQKENDKEEDVVSDETPTDPTTGERLGPRRGANFNLDHDFIWIKDGLAEVNQMIQENIGGPTELLNKYREFEPLIRASKTEKIKSLFNPKQPLEKIREELEFYDKTYSDIVYTSNDEVSFPIFKVEAGHLKKDLAEKADVMKKHILKATYDYCIKTIEEVENEFIFMSGKIKTQPETEEILVEIRSFIAESSTKVSNLEMKMNEVNKHILLLEDFCYRDKKGELARYWSLKPWPFEIASCITIGEYDIQKKEEIFMSNLENEKELFKKELKERDLALTEIRKFNNLEQSKVFAHDCHTLKNKLENDAQLVGRFNQREALFNLESSEYSQLDKLNEEFDPYYKLIPAAYEFDSDHTQWTDNKFESLPNYDEIESKVNESTRLCNEMSKKLQDDNPAAAEAANDLKEKIKVFSKHLPLIKAMKSEAIMPEDWEMVKKIVGIQENTEKGELSLNEMITANFSEHLADIEEVVMKAEKKRNLRNRLKTLKDEIKDVKIELFEHKSGTHVVRGYVDLFTVLDDQIVATQTMLGSPFMDVYLKKDAKLWEIKLKDLSDIVDEIRKCQKAWMYLEPIFASDDIHKQLPKEGPEFENIDKYWRQQMELILQDPGLLDLNDRENIKATFSTHNATLDNIQKSLNDYLGQKREVFPRFYFLANEDLLLILAQTKDPLAVQAHMDKCFEGIQELLFEDGRIVRGMVSAEGEVVKYNKEINVEEGDNKGNVENWLTDVEREMRNCLKKI